MKAEENNPDIFVSLHDLLKMEQFAHGFSFLARKQKVRSLLGGKHASKLRGRGLNFEEVRNYVLGDDIRNIDWKVTARTQKTHTRVFSEEKEKPVLIVVDQSKSMFFGSQKMTKSVVAAKLAAIATFKVVKEGDRVGGIVFADNGIDVVLPKRDRKNSLLFLGKIVRRNRELEKSVPIKFEEALREVSKRLQNIVTHDYLIIIISDFIRYSPEVIKIISRLSLHNDVILAKVFDPMEKTLPKTKFVIGNHKLQINVNATNKKIRNNFEQGFDDDYKSFEALMKKHKVPIIKINTIEPVDQQLKEVLTGIKKPKKEENITR